MQVNIMQVVAPRLASGKIIYSLMRKHTYTGNISTWSFCLLKDINRLSISLTAIFLKYKYIFFNLHLSSPYTERVRVNYIDALMNSSKTELALQSDL